MGLLDGIIEYYYWMVFFHPNLESVVGHSSQGRFCFFFVSPCSVVQLPRSGVCFSFVTPLSQKRSYVFNKLISGPILLKNDDIWSDLIK